MNYWVGWIERFDAKIAKIHKYWIIKCNLRNIHHKNTKIFNTSSSISLSCRPLLDSTCYLMLHILHVFTSLLPVFLHPSVPTRLATLLHGWSCPSCPVLIIDDQLWFRLRNHLKEQPHTDAVGGVSDCVSQLNQAQGISFRTQIFGSAVASSQTTVRDAIDSFDCHYSVRARGSSPPVVLLGQLHMCSLECLFANLWYLNAKSHKYHLMIISTSLQGHLWHWGQSIYCQEHC